MAVKKLSYPAEEIDTRLGQAHSHSNKAILDAITTAPLTIDSITFSNLSGDVADNTALAQAFQNVENSLATKQDTLVAGTGISIAADGKTISATGGLWGDIMGNIADQLDLKDALDAKQNVIADVPADSSNGKFVYSVSQTNGQIAVVSKGMDAFATGGTVSDDAYYLHGGSTNSPINKLKYLNIWNYIKDKLSIFFGISDTALPVTGGSVQIKVEKVASLPATPDPNTIYLIG